MPRIRKKTSKRGTTNQREKIKHKVSETRKKRKKDAKKNPQRKSKKTKDPGIPNNFPYRDQILAEVAEQRRIAAEEKQKRKEAKKLAASAEDEAEEDAAGDIGVSTLVGTSKVKLVPVATSKATSVEDEDEAPALLNPDLPNLEAVVEKADVVIQLLDARDPLAYRSSHLEELVKAKSEKKLLFVLNKIDTCPRESVESWARALSKEYPVFLFHSASAFLPENEPVDPKGKGKKRADDAQGVAVVLEHLESVAKSDKPLNVAVLGWTNVGKSSFINSLVRKASLPVYKLTSTSGDGPTTTLYPQEVKIALKGREANVIDTPGLSWRHSDETGGEAENHRTQDILTRSKGHVERLKDPLPVVSHIVSRAVREDLMLFYNVPAFAEGDVTAFLSGVARSNSLIKKGGALDLAGASKIVLRDWRTGKFPRFTLPSPALLENAPATSESNEKILATLKTRKEMRNATGVVKLKSSEVEKRQVELEKTWIDDESSDDEDEEEDELDEDGMDVDEDEDEDADGDEDEDVEMDEDDEDEDESEDEPPQAGKRKRGQPSKASSPVPKKKVAFSAKGAPSSKSSAPAKSILKVSSAEKTKSSLKSKVKSKAKPAVQPSASKVANGKASKAKEDDGAYDFGKFF